MGNGDTGKACSPPGQDVRLQGAERRAARHQVASAAPAAPCCRRHPCCRSCRRPRLRLRQRHVLALQPQQALEGVVLDQPLVVQLALQAGQLRAKGGGTGGYKVKV